MSELNMYHSKEDKNPFELLNTINTQRKNIHVFLLSLLVICILLIISVVFVAKKPPLVIKIDKLGHTEVVKNYSFETKLTTREDVKNFVSIFLKNYVGLRSDLVIAQFEKSLNMMTDTFAKNHLRSLKENNTIQMIQAAGVRNDVIIHKIDYEMAGDLVYANTRGTLQTKPIDQINAVPQSKILNADLVLQKVSRAPKYPYGLLLKDIKLAINKEMSEIHDNLSEVIHD